VAVSDWLRLGESHCDTWHLLGKWHGATWPSHGLPRGTVELVIGSKLYGVHGVRTVDLLPPCSALAMAARPARHSLFLVSHMVFIVFEFD
jgi:hypothetical protein